MYLHQLPPPELMRKVYLVDGRSCNSSSAFTFSPPSLRQATDGPLLLTITHTHTHTYLLVRYICISNPVCVYTHTHTHTLQSIKAPRRADNLVSCQCSFVFISSGGLRPLANHGTVQTYYRKFPLF